MWLPALVLLLQAGSPEHGPPPSGAVAQQAIAELRSPYCPGLMLEVCPSPQAELLRDSIRASAAAGASARQIVEDVLARHGEQWRAVPRRSGFGLWAWLIPPALLVGAGGWLWRRAWLSRRAAPQRADAPPEMTPEDRARLDAALREWEEVG